MKSFERSHPRDPRYARIQFLAAFLALVLLAGAPAPVPAQEDICWKDTYGRGVGTVPTGCPESQENHGGLCYPKCRSGYKPAVTLCVPECPSGYTDTGLHCLKGAAYGRGWGYPWKFGDTPFSLDEARARCKRDNGACEKCGEIIYPKCRSGYRPAGCNVCSPVCPSGMTDIGVSCQKNTYDRGAGRIPSCSPDQDSDAGLCYPKCRNSAAGVGPVCWAQCPARFPVNCGAACGVSSSTCALAVVNQVTSTGEVALNVGALMTTGGAANAALQAARTAARTAGKRALSAATRQAAKEEVKRKLVDTARWQSRNGQVNRLSNAWDKAETLDMAAEAMVDSYEKGEFDYQVLFQWEAMDPTGIASVVRAFNKPICGAP